MTEAGAPLARVMVDGEPFLRIADAGGLAPFLMSLASDGDRWLFASSSGGLTAGREDEEGCLFPYETVDRLHRAAGVSGPLTLLHVRRGTVEHLWQPFTPDPAALPERALAKSVLGHALCYEERCPDLGLRFGFQWTTGERFGFVRTATLTNEGDEPVAVALLDGLINLMPAGLSLLTQQTFSCLADAYKQNELDAATGLATFALAALIIDRAEPAECLRATTVWSRGFDQPTVLLSERQVAAFRRGEPVSTEALVTGQRGAFLLATELPLAPGESRSWDIVADVRRTQAHAAELRALLATEADPRALLRADVAAGARRLRQVLAGADAQQCTGDETACAHHLANVLFNCLRGGVMVDGAWVDGRDVAAFVGERNRMVAARHAAWLAALPARLRHADLLTGADEQGDPALLRLVHEYLPLAYSRRHGDPSRPWNRFAIRVRRPDGNLALDYQGNWRDIFQNWEALARSFPGYLPSMVAKFVNATTPDGFNAYRLTRAGIDWEAPDPGHPWSSIGYWGDHQIVYLTRLLVACRAFCPGALEGLLTRPVFSYADVPYRLAAYREILADPRHTITFDRARHDAILADEATLGSDARLVRNATGEVVHVSLCEKLLVPILSKLAAFVPDGGIWMHTQRPEWNDANNALAGYGLSMVTLCYLRRHIVAVRGLLAALTEPLVLSAAVHAWLAATVEALRHMPARTDQQRRQTMDALGTAFETYRRRVAQGGLGAPEACDPTLLTTLQELALGCLDQAIRANRREDSLFHSYNLLSAEADGDTAGIEHLPAMLEGQVAALSSGLLRPQEACDLLAALRASDLYRPDQHSYVLYPDRRLPGFLERNRVPADAVAVSPLLSALLAAGETSVLARDAAGDCRFHADFRHAGDLSAALDRLADQQPWREMVARDRADVLALYESVFHHHAFTGRSGSMYGYEGLGSIYWHMVAKLALAVQECHAAAVAAGEPPAVVARLAEHYQDIRAGLGFNKTAREYGAFPTDPYSHTPKHAGAQQPGMTGQVKEEILTRWGELGVSPVGDGLLRFAPRLLAPHEWLAAETVWAWLDERGEPRRTTLPADALGFTLCHVPVIYRRGESAEIEVVWRDGRPERRPGDVLWRQAARSLLEREGLIAEVRVTIAR